ncbi:hypothetical protein B0H94_11165 [Salsuginibacillus halophilus]|uniref:Uncharacterized protein n=1 Tax=Salsuginibacillus halophilus TaxID=517424 RepID=A0A2P8HAN4_9BACI|nr:hypothetical protein [Salsuginibacillus halophilus]PSL43241.1 hypothetical protein B0H94_11165 [Salsuginibacillus halophilus]
MAAKAASLMRFFIYASPFIFLPFVLLYVTFYLAGGLRPEDYALGIAALFAFIATSTYALFFRHWRKTSRVNLNNHETLMLMNNQFLTLLMLPVAPTILFQPLDFFTQMMLVVPVVVILMYAVFMLIINRLNQPVPQDLTSAHENEKLIFSKQIKRLKKEGRRFQTALYYEEDKEMKTVNVRPKFVVEANYETFAKVIYDQNGSITSAVLFISLFQFKKLLSS